MHSLNADEPISFSLLLGVNSTLARADAPKKACPPILSTLSGILISLKEVQYSKEFPLISVRLKLILH